MLPTQYRCNEAVQLLFDPRQTSYEALCEVLWRRIDPTLRNQVGLDRGATYRHALYAHTAEQLAQATASVEARQLALAPATVWQRGQKARLPVPHPLGGAPSRRLDLLVSHTQCK